MLRPLPLACRLPVSSLGRHPKRSSRGPATAFACFVRLRGQHSHGSHGPGPTRPLAPERGALQRAGTCPGWDLPGEGRAGRSFPSPCLSVWQPGRAAGASGPQGGVRGVLHSLGCWSCCSGGACVQSTLGSVWHTAPAAQPAVSQGRGPPPPPRPPEPVVQRVQAQSGGGLFHCRVQHQQGFCRQGGDGGAAVILRVLKGWDGKEQS